MRNPFLFFLLILISCGDGQSNKKSEGNTPTNDCFVYPESITELKLQDLYDSARWFIYTWHYDENYIPKKESSNLKTFGELPLKFHDYVFKNDTLEINFDFFDGNRAILPSMTQDNKELSTGVGFNIKTRKKIYMLSPTGFSTAIKSGNNRYNVPIQPELLVYMKSKWNKLNECFKLFAHQRGIKND